MSQYKAFYNDWIDISGMADQTGKDHTVNLNKEFFDKLDPFTDKKNKKYFLIKTIFIYI